jgi:hypothetical protein
MQQGFIWSRSCFAVSWFCRSYFAGGGLLAMFFRSCRRIRTSISSRSGDRLLFGRKPELSTIVLQRCIDSSGCRKHVERLAQEACHQHRGAEASAIASANNPDVTI